MIIEADPFAGSSHLQVDSAKDLGSLDSAGVQRFRKVSDADLTKLCDLQRLSLRDPKIEEKLFPHLYPYGAISFLSIPSKNVIQTRTRNTLLMANMLKLD